MDGYNEMLEDYELIELETGDNEIEKFFLIDSLILNEIDYFLVVEANENIDYDEEVNSYILKTSTKDTNFSDVEMVEDDLEFLEISKIFEEQSKI